MNWNQDIDIPFSFYELISLIFEERIKRVVQKEKKEWEDHFFDIDNR